MNFVCLADDKHAEQQSSKLPNLTEKEKNIGIEVENRGPGPGLGSFPV